MTRGDRASDHVIEGPGVPRSGESRIGVDIGGTFTDVVLVHQGGRLATAKVLTTPDRPAAAVLEGIERVLAETKTSAGAVEGIVHGTTLATNAIIERKGARAGLLTTKGFRDVLETGREVRYDLYDLFIDFPRPLIQRRHRIGVTERTRYDGEVLTPLDEADLRKALERLADEGISSVAVCFLHSYANPANERAAEMAIRAAHPDFNVSLSSRVLPEVGEHGRVSTTAANAYVRPIIDRYLEDLGSALDDRGLGGRLFVMSSSGGTLSVEVARELPVRLIESGPAAGAAAAAALAVRSGEPDVLSFDMGGTTAKICIITDGKPTRSTELEVARVRRWQRGSGLLLKVPSVDLIEIGAGGGSIARLDGLGLLAVGPESAGASPGPACYALGGLEPTVTDADLVLGYLDEGSFLGGRMRLDRGRAEEAMRRVADPLGLGILETARGVHEVVNGNMANAATVHASEKGVDLRRFTLLAFGGAAPAHACAIARRLGIRTVRMPYAAGVLSALGCLLAPLSFDFVIGHMRELRGVDWAWLNAAFSEMEEQGRRLLAAAGAHQAIVQRSADMRYLGQRYEVEVSLPGAGRLAPIHAERISEDFYEAYRRQYGREIRDVPIEAVQWRVIVSGERPDPHAFRGQCIPMATAKDALKGQRPVSFEGAEPHACPVYDREALGPGAAFVGPAILEESGSTAVIPPGATARVNELYDLVVELE